MPIDENQLTPKERLIYNRLTAAQKSIYLDLSDEVRGIVGRWAPQNACPSAQAAAGVCLPDPRVTSQVGIRKPTDWDLIPLDDKYSDRIFKYRIKDARKGNLLLTPGGPSGVIGAMLSALVPPQDYSHMGIVIEDDGDNGTMLRHCTGSEEWLSRKVFSTGIIFEEVLPFKRHIPLHGFRSDAVKYLWPGTITQTVEVAYKSHYHETYRDEVYELDGQGNYFWQEDEVREKQRILREKYSVLDSLRDGDDRGTGGRYRISALTFDSVWVPEKDGTPEHWAHPLIVQPCRAKRSVAVSRALSRIAEASKKLRGHYRLFSYTNGRMGENSDGPVTLEGVWEPICRNGQYVTDPVETTRGMVCSTFIWQAVRLANLLMLDHRIVLEGRPLLPEPESTGDDACAALTARWGRRRVPLAVQDPSDPADGLYFYSVALRQKAAKALQTKLRDKVMTDIVKFLDRFSGPPWVGALQGASVGSTISQLLVVNPLFLAIHLGVTKAYIDAVLEDLRKTAIHISNQWGDTFRVDNAALDNESDDWLQNPGTGNTVSPDDILNSWSAPHYEDADEVVGVYGSNICAEVLSPAPIEGEWRWSTWEISPDRTGLNVRVFRPDANGQPVYLTEAVVHVGCAELITKKIENVGMDVYQAVPEVPIGKYFAWAIWTDPATNFQWRSPRRVVAVPGPEQDIEVFPPGQSRRRVRISGNAELLIRHVSDEVPVIGTDPWESEEYFDSGWTPMSMDFSNINPADDPEFYAWLQQEHGADLKGLQERSWPNLFEMKDTALFPAWGFVTVVFNYKLDPNGSIILTIKGGTRPGMDETDYTEPDWGDDVVHIIPPKLNNADQGFQFDLKVERTGFAMRPVIRATLHIIVDNNQQSG